MHEIELNKQNLADQVYDQVKRLILSGELKGGERVPEAKLSKMFGISRTPLREALKRLSEYGLVYMKPRSYAEVVVIDAEEAKEMQQVRIHMEILTSRLCIEHADDSAFDVLQRELDDCLRLAMKGDLAGSFEADSRFHLGIAGSGGNRVLIDMMEKLDARIQLCRLNQKLSKEAVIDYAKQHIPLLDALKNRDFAAAKDIIQNHIHHGTVAG